MEITEQLEKMTDLLNGAIATKANAAEVTQLKQRVIDLQTQLDAVEAKNIERSGVGGSGSYDPNWLAEHLKENAQLQSFLKTGHGSVPLLFEGEDYRRLEMSLKMSQKTLIDSTALGNATSGVLQIDRSPGITQEARQQLRLRGILSSLPTDKPQVDYIKVSSPPVMASLQIEGLDKLENSATFTTATAPIKTIATWIPMTKQAASDGPELLAYIRTALPYYCNLREEVEFLIGAGGSVEINGMYTQAAALQPALALPAWNKSDLIAAGIQQCEQASEIIPDFVAINPQDYWQILRTKNVNRDYVFNHGSTQMDPFWGLTPVRTNKMPVGNFLVGSSSPNAVLIRDREQLRILISDSHSDYFTKNKIAILCEKRSGLCVFRPNAFVAGSFTTSP